MTLLKIDLDPEVLAHFRSAGASDVITISISLGERGVEPAPVKTRPTGPLGPLMEAGLLRSGEKLAFYQPRARRIGRATVLSNGQLTVEGQSSTFWSPSKAAEAITGNVINGWTLWHTNNGEGPTLDDLRDKLED